MTDEMWFLRISLSPIILKENLYLVASDVRFLNQNNTKMNFRNLSRGHYSPLHTFFYVQFSV